MNFEFAQLHQEFRDDQGRRLNWIEISYYRSTQDVDGRSWGLSTYGNRSLLLHIDDRSFRVTSNNHRLIRAARRIIAKWRSISRGRHCIREVDSDGGIGYYSDDECGRWGIVGTAKSLRVDKRTKRAA